MSMIVRIGDDARGEPLQIGPAYSHDVMMDALRADHPGGSLNTTPPLRGTQPHRTSEPTLNLDDDTPLTPVCPLRQGDDDGPCEACQ